MKLIFCSKFKNKLTTITASAKEQNLKLSIYEPIICT